MNGHIPESRLNDYVDGLLSAADAAEVRRHLAACIDCEREVVGLRELLGQLRALPTRVEPPRDLRPAIAAAVAGRAARPTCSGCASPRASARRPVSVGFWASRAGAQIGVHRQTRNTARRVMLASLTRPARWRGAAARPSARTPRG